MVISWMRMRMIVHGNDDVGFDETNDADDNIDNAGD